MRQSQKSFVLKTAMTRTIGSVQIPWSFWSRKQLHSQTKFLLFQPPSRWARHAFLLQPLSPPSLNFGLAFMCGCYFLFPLSSVVSTLERENNGVPPSISHVKALASSEYVGEALPHSPLWLDAWKNVRITGNVLGLKNMIPFFCKDTHPFTL